MKNNLWNCRKGLWDTFTKHTHSWDDFKFNIKYVLIPVMKGRTLFYTSWKKEIWLKSETEIKGIIIHD